MVVNLKIKSIPKRVKRLFWAVPSVCHMAHMAVICNFLPQCGEKSREVNVNKKQTVTQERALLYSL